MTLHELDARDLKEYKKRVCELIVKKNNLLAACEAAYDLLYAQMDEAEELDHATSGHDAETCILCQLREAIVKAKGE